jgi:hypothetical protein
MSVPLSLPWDKVQLFKRRFREDLFEVTLWDRETYRPEHYKNADSVLFLLPDFSFDDYIEDLPNGVRRELQDAILDEKKIYVGYITSSGDYKIYNSNVDEYRETISGIQGTGDNIFKEKVDLSIPPRNKFNDELFNDELDFSLLISDRDSYAYAVKASYHDLIGDRRLLLLM